jgi:hypothetical protein
MAAIRTEIARFIAHKRGKNEIKSPNRHPDLPDSLSPRIIKNIDLFNYSLESRIVPAWKSVEDQLILFRIEELALLLKETAVQFDFRFFDDYADSLISCLENINLDGLSDNLKQFPIILDQIRKLVTNYK